ncbi:hypothetical protein Poli38472_002220 [Pythium oligandrum]|uniref:Uncharacterized protein n=1 Tax=Pythium oligandrum TaxID=41045 RepID=A0A8K1CGT9_PYTOL|nr:hypothetical protein Poli38472_002220 [Pythium oligandrum]|eukprot:TMW63279.1 hypothetical protein Poli38472_002220 [Pythium oligandrum]
MFRSFIVALLFTSCARAYAPCEDGQFEMSVEGIEGIFCVADTPICIAQESNGSCPDVQEGLPYGSYCGRVRTGVYGCKVLDAESIKTLTPAPAQETPAPETQAPQTQAPQTPAPETQAPETQAPQTPVPETQAPETQAPQTPAPETQAPVTQAPQTPAPETQAPVTQAPQTPAPATPAPQTPAPVTQAPQTPAPVVSIVPPRGPYCGGLEGWSPMSIEGVEPVLCVQEPACVADRSSGNCPGPQEGLQWGSYCDVVRTGVYGCRPYNGTDIPTDAVYPLVRSCADNTAGDTSVSVAGADTFCAFEPVCSGNRKGNCPGKQDGLDQDSICVGIATGVFGCVLQA